MRLLIRKGSLFALNQSSLLDTQYLTVQRITEEQVRDTIGAYEKNGIPVIVETQIFNPSPLEEGDICLQVGDRGNFLIENVSTEMNRLKMIALL